MIKVVAFLVLIILNICSLRTLEEPENFKKLKKNYANFLKILPDKYKGLRHKGILTGMMNKGDLGYNINKGDEIAICIDGDENTMFHVLLHELAHSTVSEYKHSDNFWKNFDELKDIAIQNKMYKPITQATEFCGKKIKD